ncbi:hypothetical protein AHAS_Ahas13G0205800 [Arachis hypogaea]
MQKNRDKEPLLYDPEIKRTLQKQRKQVKDQEVQEIFRDESEEDTDFSMVDNIDNRVVNNPNNALPIRRSLGSYTNPNLGSCVESIVPSVIHVKNFELKPQLISFVQQSCQFSGSPQEDPNLFISKFLRICDTVKTNGVPAKVYRLMLFLFAVRDRASQWLETQPKESIVTWADLFEEQSLYEAWERYKAMIRKCPPDMFVDWVQLQIFYNGITLASRLSLDNSAGGSLHMKTTDEALDLIEIVANNQYLYSPRIQIASFRKLEIQLETRSFRCAS